MKKPEKNKIKKYVIIIGCVILIGYFVFTFINSNINNSNVVATEIAKRYTYSESISSECVIVRNEKLLNYSGSKVLYYTANDGDIVGAGSNVALVFADETDALSYNKYNELQKRIEVLKSLNTSHENVKTDYASVDKQIEVDITNIISAVNSNTPSKINESAEDLIYSINQRHIITGKISNFNAQIANLQTEAANYSGARSKYVDTISSDIGGYFVASADGYESVFDYKNVTEYTIDTFNFDAEPKKVSENTIGKIVSGLNWYIVCKLSADEALTLSHADASLNATFINTNCKNLPISLVALNQNSKQSDAVAVFKCNYMNDAISHLRNETVQISVSKHTGLKISKDALHTAYVDVVNTEDTSDKAKVMGVYVCYGSELLFKEVSILYSGADFVIVDENPVEGVLQSGETVKLNDEIVIKGENLYEGKNVEKH